MPKPDPVLDELAAAKTESERRQIEANNLKQTDNRPHEGDPEQQPGQGKVERRG